MTSAPPAALDAAAIRAQAREENFPVASRLFPRDVRRHLVNVYGFARLVDDIGDEATGDRQAILDWLSSELDEAFGGGSPSHPLMVALAETVRERSLPRAPFDRLVEANRQDQVVGRYETFDALRAYCALSANPVGELVLRICRAWNPARGALSDDVCTGLQLVEFWQDLGEDAEKGRLYVPLEDVRRFDLSPDDLASAAGGAAFVALMRFEAERTRALLARGRELSRSLRGRVGLAVRLYTAGGLAALGDLEQRRFDTFATNARAARWRRAWMAAKELSRR